MSGLTYLPQYNNDPNYANQEFYQELFNRILRDWFNNNGFSQPILTDAQVATIVSLNNPLFLGKHWYNSDQDKMQFMGASNTVQQITSV